MGHWDIRVKVSAKFRVAFPTVGGSSGFSSGWGGGGGVYLEKGGGGDLSNKFSKEFSKKKNKCT